jgi:hypothetical protein
MHSWAMQRAKTSTGKIVFIGRLPRCQDTRDLLCFAHFLILALTKLNAKLPAWLPDVN